MIYIDERSGSLDLANRLRREGIPVEIAQLEFADFAFAGNGPDGPLMIGIERKTIQDAINSMRSGRLSGHQLPGLIEHYDRIYLVVEGMWRPTIEGILEVHLGKWRPYGWGKKRFMYAELDNYLTSLEEFGRVRVKRTFGPMETGKVIKDLYGWWQKEHEEHRGYTGWDSPVAPKGFKPKRVARFAKEFKGFGWERANNAAKRFKTLREMFNAEESEWIEVEGVGKGLAKQAVRESTEEEP